MVTTTTVYSFQKPDVSGDEDAWGGYLNANIDKYESILTGNTTITSLVITTADINGGTLDNVVIGGSTAAAVTGTTITGTGFASTGNMTFGDNNKAIFGAGSDLSIFHDGSNSKISDSGTGNLHILADNEVYIANAGNSEYKARFITDGAVELYYDAAKKFETTSTGVDVTGTVTADGLTVETSGDPSALIRNTSTGTVSLTLRRSANDDAYTDWTFDNTGGNLSIISDDTTRPNATRIKMTYDGDISFYEDTGTTAKLFWDASEESLGIGTSSPQYQKFVINTPDENHMRLENGAELAIIRLMDAGILDFWSHGTSNNEITFSQGVGSGSEVMRIDSSGRLLLNTTVEGYTDYADDFTISNTSGRSGMTIRSGNTSQGSIFFSDVNSNSDAGGYAGYVTYHHNDNRLAFGTSGAERMRIHNSGRISINTTADNSAILEAKQDTDGYSRGFRATSITTATSYVALSMLNGTDAAVTVGSSASTSTNLAFYTASSGAETERMRIASYGSVGIGTSNPTNFSTYRYLDVVGSATGTGGVLQLKTSDGSVNLNMYSYSLGGVLGTATNHFLALTTNNSTRMVIDASGNIGIGTTSPSSEVKLDVDTGANSHAARFRCDTGGYACAIFDNQASSGTRNFTSFRINNSPVGSITSTGSTTAYNTSSDHRLKENVVDLTNATTRLKQLEPKRFNFIADADTTVDGFLAHEVQSVVPEAITGTHNEVDADGNPVYQGIDQSKLVPLLVATIKELEARITALEGE